MRNELVIADYGPDFYGWTSQVGERIVCVATPRVEEELPVRRLVRNLIRRHGGDCDTCRGCIIASDE